MAKIQIQVDPTVTGGYTLLPEAVYDFEVRECEQTTSKQKGTPTILLKLTVIGGPSNVGKEMQHWHTLHPKGAWKTKQMLEAMGVPYEEQDVNTAGGVMKVVVFDDEHLPGSRFRSAVKHREYNGKTNEEFEKYEVSPLDNRQPAAAAAPTAAVAAPAAAGVLAPTAAPAQTVVAPAAAAAPASNVVRRRAVPSA